MKENFLPIPAAPNYEINSELICRNIKTGYILKLFQGKTCPYYSLRITGSTKCFQRSPKLLRRLAVVAAQNDTFEPIPSLNYKYEINLRGVVRNSKSKHIMKTKCNGACVCIQMGKGKYISCAIKDLLWEVHGIIKPRRFRPAPCSAENQCGKFFFKTKKHCARFLAPKVFLAVSTVYNYLLKREKNIFGWVINYD